MKHREEKKLRKSVQTVLNAADSEVQQLPGGHEKEMVQRVRRWAEDF